MGRERPCVQSNQCFGMGCWCWCWNGGWGDSLEGETWFSSLEITSTQWLLGRNIKIQPDISQVLYQALSDPIPPYHTLHTLKHGYPFLDTLLTFKCKRWEETRLVLHRMEEFGWSFIFRLANPKPLKLWVVFEIHLKKHLPKALVVFVVSKVV